MARFKLFWLVCILALTACSDGSGRIDAQDQAQILPLLLVDFPPSRARHLGEHMPVHGRVQHNQPSAVSVHIETAAGSVMADVAEDGSWIAEAVPLSAEAVTTIVVSANDGEGWQTETVASEVQRFAPVRAPIGVAPGFQAGHFFLNYGSFSEGQIREIGADGEEVRRYIAAAEGQFTHKQLEPLAATGEVLGLYKFQGGGCGLLASDLEAQTERTLIQIFEPELGPSSGCTLLDFRATGDRVVIINHYRQEILTLNAAGDVLNRASSDAPFSSNGELLDVNPDTHSLRFIQERVETDEAVVELLTVDTDSGALVEMSTNRVGERFDQEPIVSASTDSVFWLDGQAHLFQLDDERSSVFNLSGFIPTDIIAMSRADQNSLYLLDNKGRLSRLDPDIGDSELIYESDPYYHPATVINNNRASDGGLLLGNSHSQTRLVTSPILNKVSPETRHWLNLYSLDIDTQQLSGLFATSSQRGGLRSPVRVIDESASVELSQPEGQPATLARVDHATGDRSPYDLSGTHWRADGDYVVSLGGDYIVVKTLEGIFEHRLADGGLTGRMGYGGDFGLSQRLDVLARTPDDSSAAGEVYVSDSGENGLFRVDFDNNTRVEISGPNVGIGEDFPQADELVSLYWPSSGESVYVSASINRGISSANIIMQVDLATGDRETVFTLEPGQEYAVPARLYNFHVLEDRQAAIAIDREVFYLDFKTGASVAIPLSYDD